MRVVVCRPYTAQPRAYVPQSSGYGSESRDKVQPDNGHQDHPKDKEAQHEGLEAKDIGYDVTGDHLVPNTYWDDGAGMKQPLDLSADKLQQDHQTDNLHAAAGASRTSSDEHEYEQDELGGSRPLFIVRRPKTCRGQDRDNLEESRAKGRLEPGEVMPESVETNEEHTAADQKHEKVEFMILSVAVEFFLQEFVVKRKTRPGQDHKHNDHILDIG